MQRTTAKRAGGLERCVAKGLYLDFNDLCNWAVVQNKAGCVDYGEFREIGYNHQGHSSLEDQEVSLASIHSKLCDPQLTGTAIITPGEAIISCIDQD